MAGLPFKLTVTDKDVLRALGDLAHKDGGLVRASLKNIGIAMVKSVRKRFDAEQAPDGTPWKQLSPAYKAGKKGQKILQESGMRGGLLGTIVWQLQGSDKVAIGTNKKYAAVHQFGATILPRRGDFLVFKLGGRLVFARKVVIPARPFLGISVADRQTILDTIEDVAAANWSGTAHP
ncbi:MAG TPA: phage virion morphogenesis protein [Aliidongia sp.]|uniref:phage virion morphogenesis protein n=1 Tax=Aliidongia sp. TaxID=1914230 RepID=UPI002DDCE1DA|nr:phage virion morphogenesis protein [Aliidongia sp.]HEV2678783.1 phage virion morphogenesis protein [Aliidongia sp.]